MEINRGLGREQKRVNLRKRVKKRARKNMFEEWGEEEKQEKGGSYERRAEVE